MKHYHGYWLVLAIIKQYLGNVKKKLARDLNEEQDDPRLPGLYKPVKTRLKKKASTKAPKRRSDDSDKDSEFEEDEVEVEVEEGDKDDEDKFEDNDEDEANPEDDRAEMDLFDYYEGVLGHNDNAKAKSDEDDEGNESDYRETPSVEEFVAYRLFSFDHLLTLSNNDRKTPVQKPFPINLW